MRKTIVSSMTILLLVVSTASAQDTQPLTLAESMQIALKNNHNLLASEKKVSSAKEGICKAKTDFYPTVGLESSYTRLNEPPTMDVMGKSFTLGDENIYDAKAVLKQPLFTGGKISSAYRIALYNYEVCEDEYRRVKDEITLDVQKAYFGILAAQKFLEVARESVKQISAHLELAKNYYEVGMVAKVDVLKAEVQLANVTQNLVRAENRAKLARAGFNNLLGREQNTTVEVVEILEVKPQDVGLDACIKKAQNNRPELRQIQANLRILEEMVTIAKSRYYPSVAMLGNYDYQKGNKPENEWEKTWMVGVRVNLELWNWGATAAGLKQAKEDLEAIKEQESLLKDEIELDVREAYLSLEEAEKNIETAQKSIGQSEENLRITNQMYKEGVTTSTEVLDAQTLVTQTKTNYYQALYDYHLAWAKIEKATGGME